MMIYNQMIGLVTFLIILSIAGVIALVSFLIYRYLHPKIKSDKEMDEKEIVKEELNRVLEPIEDDDLAKKVADYVEDDE